MRKIAFTLVLIIAIFGLTLSPKTPVAQCADCKTTAKICHDLADNLMYLCAAMGFPPDRCVNDSVTYFENCMWDNGCNPYPQ